MEGAPGQSQLKRATATVDCPKSMVGRVIGKSGETIKALQTYTGALIQASIWWPWLVLGSLEVYAAPQNDFQYPFESCYRFGPLSEATTALILQIDQTVEPTKVTISGTPHSLSLAVSMVTDIVKGTFKGFALLRQITNPGGARPVPLGNPMAQPRPVYAPGYGLIPPSQVSYYTCMAPASCPPTSSYRPCTPLRIVWLF
jgi:hypothetical protein